MPSKTQRQHNFFEAVKHSPAMQQRTGVSEKVADEYLQADKRAGKFQHNPLVPKTK
jgi:DNA-binding cell septation regulator SpoVG